MGRGQRVRTCVAQTVLRGVLTLSSSGGGIAFTTGGTGKLEQMINFARKRGGVNAADLFELDGWITWPGR